MIQRRSLPAPARSGAGDLFVNAPALQHRRIASRLRSALVVWTDGGAARGEAIHEPAVQAHPPVTARLALTG